MSTKEKKAYRAGQRAVIETALVLIGWSAIIIAALIKAGIYVI